MTAQYSAVQLHTLRTVQCSSHLFQLQRADVIAPRLCVVAVFVVVVVVVVVIVVGDGVSADGGSRAGCHNASVG